MSALARFGLAVATFMSCASAGAQQHPCKRYVTVVSTEQAASSAGRFTYWVTLRNLSSNLDISVTLKAAFFGSTAAYRPYQTIRVRIGETKRVDIGYGPRLGTYGVIEKGVDDDRMLLSSKQPVILANDCIPMDPTTR